MTTNTPREEADDRFVSTTRGGKWSRPRLVVRRDPASGANRLVARKCEDSQRTRSRKGLNQDRRADRDGMSTRGGVTTHPRPVREGPDPATP